MFLPIGYSVMAKHLLKGGREGGREREREGERERERERERECVGDKGTPQTTGKLAVIYFY
jgi:hypothetical protein